MVCFDSAEILRAIGDDVRHGTLCGEKKLDWIKIIKVKKRVYPHGSPKGPIECPYNVPRENSRTSIEKRPRKVSPDS